MEATLHRDCYLEESWFAKEREHIFFAEWTCVARESDIPKSGDYKAINLTGESILLVRGEDDKLRAFFNVCRHRGCQLVDSLAPEQKSGRFKTNIRCPYHSWVYKLDGALHHAPPKKNTTCTKWRWIAGEASSLSGLSHPTERLPISLATFQSGLVATRSLSSCVVSA
jgi:phenylpropionate dioxygenase-like ring-hydroxylating dioxygenase large terminal subunit